MVQKSDNKNWLLRLFNMWIGVMAAREVDSVLLTLSVLMTFITPGPQAGYVG